MSAASSAFRAPLSPRVVVLGVHTQVSPAVWTGSATEGPLARGPLPIIGARFPGAVTPSVRTLDEISNHTSR